MKSKVMILSFFVGLVSAGWGQVLDPGSVRFDNGDLRAIVREDVTNLELSISFLAPGQDPRSVSWSTSVIEVRDAAIQLSPKDWFSDPVPKGGILLLRFGPDEVIWGIRKLHLGAGENWVGTWGPLGSRQVAFPEGLDWTVPSGRCQPMRVQVDQAHSGVTGLVVMPFEEGSACTIPIPVDRPATAFCLSGFRAWGLAELGLIESGFQGGSNPVQSDRIWKLNPVTGIVDATYWYRITDQTWRSTAKGFPAIEGDLFFPGDVVVIKPRVSTKDWVLSPGSNGSSL